MHRRFCTVHSGTATVLLGSTSADYTRKSLYTLEHSVYRLVYMYIRGDAIERPSAFSLFANYDLVYSLPRFHCKYYYALIFYKLGLVAE